MDAEGGLGAEWTTLSHCASQDPVVPDERSLLDSAKRTFSAYRFHDEAPIFFRKSLRLTCRAGEILDGKKLHAAPRTRFTAYVWAYSWQPPWSAYLVARLTSRTGMTVFDCLFALTLLCEAWYRLGPMNSKGLPWIIASVLLLGALLLLRPSVASPTMRLEEGPSAISSFIPDSNDKTDGHVIVTYNGKVYLVRKFGSTLTVKNWAHLP